MKAYQLKIMIKGSHPPISAWKNNAKQHFDDGNYYWICDRIHQIPFEVVIKRLCI